MPTSVGFVLQLHEEMLAEASTTGRASTKSTTHLRLVDAEAAAIVAKIVSTHRHRTCDRLTVSPVTGRFVAFTWKTKPPYLFFIEWTRNYRNSLLRF